MDFDVYGNSRNPFFDLSYPSQTSVFSLKSCGIIMAIRILATLDPHEWSCDRFRNMGCITWASEATPTITCKKGRLYRVPARPLNITQKP